MEFWEGVVLGLGAFYILLLVVYLLVDVFLDDKAPGGW